MTEITDGSIDMAPKWQRRDIWSDKKKSALIESIFFNLPLPLFYLARAEKETDGEGIVAYREIVDGQQRMRAIRSFFQGNLCMPDDSVVNDLRGKTYAELSARKQAFFKQFKLSTATIPLQSEVSKYELFRRLNQNPTTLSDQELRNAAYHGEYLDLLIEKAELLKEALRITEANYKRMKDVEFLTRLVAFERRGYEAFPNKRLAQFLNQEMDFGIGEAASSRTRRLARVAKALERVELVFGDLRFRPFRISDDSDDGEWASQLNRPLMEVQVWSFLDHARYGFSSGAAFSSALVEGRLEIIANARRLHVLDDRFNDTLQRGTTGLPNVVHRFSRYAAMIAYSLADVPDGRRRRFFTRQQKQNIWDRKAEEGPVVCGECRHVLQFETAEVDHIVAFANGGETVEANGQLLHPRCNRAKGSRWDPVLEEVGSG
jgi:hypothetical protein